MKTISWKKVEQIFHTALDLSVEDRNSYLQKECAGDTALFSEVKSLLSSFEQNSDFLDEPVFELGLEAINGKAQNNLAGSVLGFYELQEKIGAGGMGEVYKALDTQLNRRVALKFLSESLENDNAARRRLIKEAQAVAMLEHPNICAVYGIEQSDKHCFIVMQYIEGETLAECIACRNLPVEEFKVLARQILTAVAFAHSHGVIHRDLKPGNIMLAPDGQIKVLDFGLAKVLPHKQPFGRDASDEMSRFSQNGLIIGTVSYMSPEQLRGEKLDYQSDIFSIGIVLYELLTGQNPFKRESQAETIAAILSSAPPALKELSPEIPENLINLVEKCLQKDKEKRFQSAAEILVELENIGEPVKTGFFTRKLLAARSYSILIMFFLLLSFAGIFLYLNRNPSIPAFAILPITNESNNSEIDYLSEGLTGELINKFSKFSKLKVKSLISVSKYKGQSIDPSTIGKELNVDMIMTGKISKRENSLIFQVALVNVTDNSQVWGNEYNLDITNLTKTQEDVVTQVNSKFNLNLSNEEINLLNKVQTTFPEAEDQYYRGLHYLNHRTPANIAKAITHFEKAIEIDPVYARAYSGLADSYVFKSSPAFGSLTPKDSIIKAKSAVGKALQFDKNLSEAYNTLGLIKLKYDWDWQEAENNFVKSIELNPNYDQPYYWYSHLLILRKDFAGALSKAKKAQELEPLSPNNEINVGRIYYYERRSDKAIQTFSQILQENPSNRGAAYMLGLTYMQKGLYQKAIDVFEKFYDNDQLYFAAQLGYAYGKMNRKTDAQRILAELEKLSAEGAAVVPPQEKAIINLGMGNKDLAFELFRQSCEERFASFPFIVTEAFFDDLQSDPEFIFLTRCIQPIN
jgi:eukaryotic-like serine/threonine-protein kinase